MVPAIHRAELRGTLQEWSYITFDMPFGVATSPARLDITRKSVVASPAECVTLRLALFTCYQYIQMFHRSLPLIMGRGSVVPTIFFFDVLCPNPCPTAKIGQGFVLHPMDASGAKGKFLLCFHIHYFVCDGLSPIGFTTYRQGVKSHGVGNGVKRSKRVRTYAPPHGCACTGVGAPAHTR